MFFGQEKQVPGLKLKKARSWNMDKESATFYPNSYQINSRRCLHYKLS